MQYGTHSQAIDTGQAILPVNFHGIDLGALHAGSRKAKWTTSTPLAAKLSRRYLGYSNGIDVHR